MLKYSAFKEVRRHLLLGAIAVLIVFCAYFHCAISRFEETLLQERLSGYQSEVDCICNTIDYLVDLDKNWDTHNYQKTLSYMVSNIRATGDTYAELFDDQLNRLPVGTPLLAGLSFPLEEYPEIVDSVKSADNGKTRAQCVGPAEREYDLSFYWRWVPTDRECKNRLLVVIGVSKCSVNASMRDPVTYGTAALIVVTSIFIVGSLMIVTVRKSHKRKEV